jgi:Zn-dependent protease/CBS domain-containing protein
MPGTTTRVRIAFRKNGGTEVSIDWTVPFLLAAILLGFRLSILPRQFPHWSGASYWAFGFLAALSFFVSVIAHEIARAATGLTIGLLVDRVTLFPFAGNTQFRLRPRSPSIEMTTVLIGPAIHLVLGASMMALVPHRPIAELSPVEALLGWIGAINFALALVHLLPAFPLDGGRALRAILWSFTRDLTRATRWAAAIGQLFAWTLMALGIGVAFGFDAPYIGGSRFHGLWVLAGGWLLNHAAVISYAEDFVRDRLSHVRVSELMHDEPSAVSRATSLSSFIANAMSTPHQRTVPVVDDDRLLGYVRIADAVQIPEEDWRRTPVGEIMIPASEIPMLDASDDADLALQILVRQPVEQLPVVEGSRVLGFVHRWDIVHWLIDHDVPA